MVDPGTSNSAAQRLPRRASTPTAVSAPWQLQTAGGRRSSPLAPVEDRPTPLRSMSRRETCPSRGCRSTLSSECTLCQLMTRGYGSESEMAQDIAPDDSSPLPSPSGASNSTNGSNAGGNTGSNTGGNTGSNTGGNTGGNIASSSPTVAGHASGTSGTGPTLGPAPAGPAAAGYANAPAFAFLVGGAIAGLAAM